MRNVKGLERLNTINLRREWVPGNSLFNLPPGSIQCFNQIGMETIVLQTPQTDP